jgi:hypothetical protein
MVEFMLVHIPLANCAAWLAFGHLPSFPPAYCQAFLGIREFVVYNR